jgi:hypothetical protein
VVLSKQQAWPEVTAQGTPPHQTEFDAGALVHTNTVACVPVPGAQYWPGAQSASAPQKRRPTHVAEQAASRLPSVLQQIVPLEQSSVPSHE